MGTAAATAGLGLRRGVRAVAGARRSGRLRAVRMVACDVFLFKASRFFFEGGVRLRRFSCGGEEGAHHV